MKQKSEMQQQLADKLKTVRSEIRLKHSLAADRELNEVLPRVEEEFYTGVHKGQL